MSNCDNNLDEIRSDQQSNSSKIVNDILNTDSNSGNETNIIV